MLLILKTKMGVYGYGIEHINVNDRLILIELWSLGGEGAVAFPIGGSDALVLKVDDLM